LPQPLTVSRCRFGRDFSQALDARRLDECPQQPLGRVDILRGSLRLAHLARVQVDDFSDRASAVLDHQLRPGVDQARPDRVDPLGFLPQNPLGRPPVGRAR
jgi:hypothetical protein